MTDNAQARLGRDFLVELLVGMTVRMLPADQRVRYAEEFHAELADLQGWQRISHSAMLLCTSWSLRRCLRSSAPLARQRRHRFLIPIASAAAVCAIAFVGVSLVARNAQPGDALWPLTRVLYADHARSVEAAVITRVDLEIARAALREGRFTKAREQLDRVSAYITSVNPKHGKSDLAKNHEVLVRELTSTPADPLSASATANGTR